MAHLMPGSVIRRNVCHGVGPEAARGLLLVVADLLEHGHDLADDQRQRDEAVAMIMPGVAKMTWRPLSSRVGPNQPYAAVVDQHQGQADDDRRHRQRQVDERRQHPLARELVAHQQQRHADAEHRLMITAATATIAR